MVKKSEWTIERAEELMEQAYACLDDGELGRARKLGKELVAMRYTGGYEILALCYLRQKKAKKAIEILKLGTERAPEAWPLWRKLGNLHSDQGEYELAHDYYDKALGCPGVDQASVNFNRAIVLYREHRHAESLKLLEELPPEWVTESASLKASVLNGLKRYDETIALCQTIIDTSIEPGVPGIQAELKRDDMESLFTDMAWAFWSKGERADALCAIKKAVDWCAFSKRAISTQESRLNELLVAFAQRDYYSFTLYKLREIHNRTSDHARHYTVTVRGKWFEPIEGDDYIPDFVRVFQIVADSLEEALEFAKEFEPQEVAASLSVQECKEVEAQSESLKGVCGLSCRIFIDRE